MKRVFVDTHFYLALLNPRDQWHAQAFNIARRDAYAQVVTTYWVLTEVADAMAHPRTRGRFAAYLTALQVNPSQVQILGGETGLFWRGFDHYKRRPDKDWSLTDCISFVVMAEEELTQALTADHHFEQAGFTALLLANG